ncbi:hypothetical protein LWI29_004743 [Acer saccharum]|uniref:non-specific serine/threonine protein kinase n=1 Tax=Acer saccharum TaxID=4024 RepID=A0AA39W4Q1_ACESA|nr:hypothetical protein LWI29_004743 [Acer saccharum]
MPNGSLDKLLYNKKKSNLDWFQRFRILRGVASGLLYLHEDWEQVVLHRDIKPGNVLLDADLNGKLGDFGLARLHDHGSNPQTTKLVGTIGYMAPELPITGKASASTDVYAFGVFMLELACGKRPMEQRGFVIDCWKRGAILDASDPRLEDADFNGKLGDFGLARLHDHGSNPQTTKLVGTIGYIAPELPITGKASTSTDVYAFGVFMLEVACGKRPTEQQRFVIDCWRRGAILDASDLRLEDTAPFIDFVSSCLHILDDGELDLICIIWWRIWYDRNLWVHSGERINLGDVAAWCSSYLREFKDANLVEDGRLGMVIPSPARWQPPSSGLYKLNTDASLDSTSQRIGLGMVIRDQEGFVMGSSAQRVDVNFSPKVAEALAILRGLIFAVDTRLLLVSVKSDVLEVMLWIQVYFMFVRSQLAESKHARKPMFTCEFCCLPSSDLVLTKSTPYSEVGDLVSDILEFVEAFIPSLKFEF